jgi:hypothetical protein
VFQQPDVEVDQESNRYIQQFQVCEELSFMDGKKSLNALKFHNHCVLYQEIKAVATIETHSLIEDRHGDLPPKTQASKIQFVAQTLFICGFQKARP